MLLPGESAEAMARPEQVRALLARHIDPDRVQIERATVYTFHALLADRWQDRRLFLLGDAAHQMPPFLGQGMCAGIRDAHNLSWKLAMVSSGQATPALLETYQSERRPHVLKVIQLVRWAGGIIQTRRRPVAFLRDSLLRAAATIPPVRRRLRQLETVIPSLRQGCLDQGNQIAGKLMPQPSVLAADGRERLLDELLGDGFTLITVGEEIPALATRSLPLQHLHILPPESARSPTWTPLSAVDRSGLLWQWCRRAGIALVLLRPDRYVFGGYAPDEVVLGLERLAYALNGRW
jgi:3-(3-hydroxy-phenyl)propionate hydroxylase